MDRRWFEWLREEDARSRAGRLGAAPELRAAVVHERPVADRTGGLFVAKNSKPQGTNLQCRNFLGQSPRETRGA
jgi:hypothetical protein